jgi:hypothetical protein
MACGAWCGVLIGAALGLACTRRDTLDKPSSAPALTSAATPAPAPSASTTDSAVAGNRVGPLDAAGDSWSFTRDGAVRVLGRGVHAIHNHGGPPAWIASADFEIENTRSTPVRIGVSDIEFTATYGCDDRKVEKTQPKFAEIRLADQAGNRAQSLVVPARKKLSVEIGYAAQEVYLTFCETCQTRVTLDVAGEPLIFDVEHRVTRRTPLKR